jgi:hypothetical protein
VRSLGISLFNDHDDSDNAINFIKEAKNIAHSNDLREKYIKDLKDLADILSEKQKQLEKISSILKKPILLKNLELSTDMVEELIKQ